MQITPHQGAAARRSPLRLAFAATAAALALGLSAPVRAADPNLPRNLAATCANCHGTNGQAVGDMRPLAGVPAERIIAMMSEYKAGTLTATIMHQIAKGYSDEQIRLIATYFAAQAPRK